MTIHWFILACMAFVIIAWAVRGRPGDGLTSIIVLTLLFALIGVAWMVVSRFAYIGDIGWWAAAALAFLFALDALYGLMAPQRQVRRDRRLRELLRRRRHA